MLFAISFEPWERGWSKATSDVFPITSAADVKNFELERLGQIRWQDWIIFGFYFMRKSRVWDNNTV